MLKKIVAALPYTSLMYIFLPYIIFVTGWMNTPSTFLFLSIILGSIYEIRSKIQMPDFFRNKELHSFIWKTGVLFFFIIFLSGITGYVFQNDDFLYRNAIFRDLIKYDWPVTQKVNGFGQHSLEGKIAIMTYYVGFFLPAAMIGKIFGFGAGQVALLLWVWLGAILVTLNICLYLKRISFKVVWLFLSWGTLFYIGVWYFYGFSNLIYQVEYLWAGWIFYADSNLGGMYWVFNQTFTCWLIILWIMNFGQPKTTLFVYSFCIFLSPFAFVGLAPFVLYWIFRGKESLIKKVSVHISFANTVGALSVMILTYLYLSSNQGGRFFRFIAPQSLPRFLLFYLLSWVGLALLLFKRLKKEPLFGIILLVLLPLPFFQQGHGIDFPGRVSLPSMFIFMLLLLNIYFDGHSSILQKRIILTYFIASGLGSFLQNPIRSIYFTSIQYLANHTNLSQDWKGSNSKSFSNFVNILEDAKSKDLLTKDLGTLTNPKNEVLGNYMSDTEESLFYTYLAKKP